MKGYELMKEIAEGKIKEGTRFKVTFVEDNYICDYTWINGNLINKCNEDLIKTHRLEHVLDLNFEIIQEPKKRWRAKIRQEYFYINAHGGVDLMTECNDRSDNYRYKTYNYFRTKSEVKAHLDNINTYYELKALAEELNGDEEIDWENEAQVKYYIEYDNIDKELCLQHRSHLNSLGCIYCLNENFFKKAKSRIGKDRLVKLFKENK